MGGDHSINGALAEHSKLIHFLHDHEKEIYIAPMVEIAGYIRRTRGVSKTDTPTPSLPATR